MQHSVYKKKLLISFFLLEKSEHIFYNIVGGNMKEKIIFHIDVNNAYLSWTASELLKEGYKKDIRKIPSVIGGDENSRHGVVLAKSPVAKQMGVVTGETIYNAKKKCPDLKVFPPVYWLYSKKSEDLFSFLATYTPDLRQFSIDEAFLDMSNMDYIYGDIIKLAYSIKEEIKKRFGFTVNIGIGNNNLCAKMASDFEKPDKVHTLFSYEIKDKMWPLPVERLLYVGKSSVKRLKNLGINTIGELANSDVKILKPYFKNMAYDLIKRARGIDNTDFRDVEAKNKSISISRTLPKDIIDKKSFYKILLEEADEVGRTLRKKNKFAKTIVVTFRNNKFFDYSHQVTLSEGINSTMDIYNEVIKVFEASWRHDYIRNIGIRLDNLCDKSVVQLNLFSGSKKIKDHSIQNVVDKINDKFGNNCVTLASLKKKD